MLYFLINNKPILIRSMVAATIVQNTLAGEAVENEGGEEETTGGYFYCYFFWYFYRSGQKVFRFLALEYNLQNPNARMRIRNRSTYYIYIAYYKSKSVIMLVISRVASYFYEPKASANTAYE